MPRLTEKLLCILIALCLYTLAFAAEPADVTVHSEAMHKDIHNLIMLPEDYETGKRYPVVYLLHGHNMKYFEWLRVQRDLPKLATEHGVILVCPDGANSWYWDSPVNPALRYETYVSEELPKYVDAHYNTIATKQGRAITGLSMGGHGALWLAIRHQNTFGACGSMSGGVDIRPFPNNWNIADSLGRYEDNPTRWAEHTVMTQLNKITPGALAIIIDCGTHDFFYEINENLHRALLKLNIPHDYLSRPGVHNARYWRNAILYQLLFFAEYFKSAQQEQK